MPRRSTLSSVRVDRQGWGGAYERLDRPAGVVALLPGPACEAAYTRALCAALHERGLSTLCLDALSAADPQLAEARLMPALDWLQQASGGTPLGVFAGGRGMAAALRAAAARPAHVAALVLHGALPAALLDALPQVQAATLLLVGDAGPGVLQAQRRALPMLGGARRREVVPGADADGADAAANQAVADLAAHWFAQQLPIRRLH